MKLRFLLAMVAAGLLSGCAGMSSPVPVYAMPAKLYAASEKLLPGPGRDLDASGEVRYCERLDVIDGNNRGAQLKKSALDNIAKVCGGEDNYYVLKDLETGETTRYLAAGGLVASYCPATTGRAIYFKCKGGGAQPAAPAKAK